MKSKKRPAPKKTSPTRKPAPAPSTPANVPHEVTFTAQGGYADPFNQVVLDVIFTDPAGQAFRVPAFWAGANRWKVRYASPLTGEHAYRTECNVATDAGLHGLTGRITVKPYHGKNPLYVHGPVQVAADRRHFEHHDGTPFFWLGDTWWMGLCHRLKWPQGFKQLTANRVKKPWPNTRLVSVDNDATVGISVSRSEKLHVFHQSGQQFVVAGLDRGQAALRDLVTYLVGK